MSGAQAPGCTLAICPLLVQTHKRRLILRLRDSGGCAALVLPALRGAIVLTGGDGRPQGRCLSRAWPELWVDVSGSLGSTCFVFCVEWSENRGVADGEGTERER